MKIKATKIIIMTELFKAELRQPRKYKTIVADWMGQHFGWENAPKISDQIQPLGNNIIICEQKNNLDESDHRLEKFLNLIEKDIAKNPQHRKAITSSTVERVRSLIGDISVDLDAPLEDEEE